MGYLLGLACESSIKLNNAVFYAISLTALFAFVSSVMSDNLGRKNTFFVVSVVGAIGAVVSLARLDYDYIVAGICIQTLCIEYFRQ